LQYNTNSKSIDESENIDGAPLSDPENLDNEDLDGIPLDGATLLKHAYDDTPPGDTDIDGTPCKLSIRYKTYIAVISRHKVINMHVCCIIFKITKVMLLVSPIQSS